MQLMSFSDLVPLVVNWPPWSPLPASGPLWFCMPRNSFHLTGLVILLSQLKTSDLDFKCYLFLRIPVSWSGDQLKCWQPDTIGQLWNWSRCVFVSPKQNTELITMETNFYFATLHAVAHQNAVFYFCNNIGVMEWFLERAQRVSCQHADNYIVNLFVCPSICPSIRLSLTHWHCVKMTQATITRSSLEDSPMTLVSSR